MIDWNNDGKIDGEDVILTEIILDDEDGGEGNSGSKPHGSCLVSLILMLGLPSLLVAVLTI